MFIIGVSNRCICYLEYNIINNRFQLLYTLTVEATPSSDVAGLIVGQNETRLRNTSSHDGVSEGDRRLQFDQGDVITVEDLVWIIHRNYFLNVFFPFPYSYYFTG